MTNTDRDIKTKIVRLHGDGFNDDTEAIQAFIDGRIISKADGSPVSDTPEPGEYIVREGAGSAGAGSAG